MNHWFFFHNNYICRIHYVVSIVVLSTLFGCSFGPDYLKFSNDLKIDTSLGEFDRTQSRQIGNSKKETYKLAKDSMTIRSYPNLSTKEAKLKIEQKHKLIMDIFQSHPSAYPGIISNRMECPEKYKPVLISKEINQNWTKGLILSANKRKTYGACTEKEIHYLAVFSHIYCSGSDTLFEVKYFTPIDHPSFEGRRFMEMFSCK